MTREIHDHKVTRLNRDYVTVFATDERNEDGGNHQYKVYAECPFDKIIEVELQFQNGGLQDVGVNGITDQALLAIVLDRLKGFNSGPFMCRENSIAITKIEEALLWMGKRAAERSVRGVEGVRAE